MPDNPSAILPALKVLVCGSVDDGKSTLIGRLLNDTGHIRQDEQAQLAALSEPGTTDFWRLTDGLIAEQQQGVTIDIAYRQLTATPRGIVLIDAPGHQQHTRNMATGASNADIAVVLVDATRGISEQSARHVLISSLMGVSDLVLAVNKMDQVGWDEATFANIAREFSQLAKQASARVLIAIPISALNGDNLVKASRHALWYQGLTLMAALHAFDPPQSSSDAPFRMSVQQVIRHDGRRYYGGRIASGTLTPGDLIKVSPSGIEATVAEITVGDTSLESASVGRSVNLRLEQDIDLTRGDALAGVDTPVDTTDQFEADLIWMAEAPLLPGRTYRLRLGTDLALAQVTSLKHRLDPVSMEKQAATKLELNDIGRCTLSLGRALPFTTYEENKRLGGFILIDRQSAATLGAGLIRHGLRRAENIHRQDFTIDSAARAERLGQRPACIWLTGLSGAGKSTIADALDKQLFEIGRHVYVLDGDNVRHGLNRDLGFTDADRVENVRRVAETARLMCDAGLIVITALISPFEAERDMAKQRFDDGVFYEVYVNTPLELAEQRDPKGLYAKARAGELPNFTGIDSPYEPPKQPALRIDTDQLSPDQAALAIIEMLDKNGII